MRRRWYAALLIHVVACTHLSAGQPERRRSAPWYLGWRLEGSIRRDGSIGEERFGHSRDWRDPRHGGLFIRT